MILKVAQAMHNARAKKMTPEELQAWLRDRYWVEGDADAAQAGGKEYVEKKKNEYYELFGGFDQLKKDLDQRQRLYELLERAANMNEEWNNTDYVDRALNDMRTARNAALFAKYLPEVGPVDFDKVPPKYARILQAELPDSLFEKSKLPRKRSLPYKDDLVGKWWRRFDRDAVLSGKYGRVLKKIYEKGYMQTQNDWWDAVQAHATTMPKKLREDLDKWLKWNNEDNRQSLCPSRVDSMMNMHKQALEARKDGYKSDIDAWITGMLEQVDELNKTPEFQAWLRTRGLAYDDDQQFVVDPSTGAAYPVDRLLDDYSEHLSQQPAQAKTAGLYKQALAASRAAESNEPDAVRDVRTSLAKLLKADRTRSVST